MINNDKQDLDVFNASKNNTPFNSDIESIPISEKQYHYICTECKKFPFIEFCKDLKNIKYTCRCVNNKKILIKDLVDKIKENFELPVIFPSEREIPEVNNNDIDGLLCKEHNKKYEYFCTTCLTNICKNCYLFDHAIHKTVCFKDIKIDDNDMDILIKKTKENISYDDEIISLKIEKTKLIETNNYINLITKEEENYFYQLINIIINDYCNCPNYIHFFNIKNIFHFLKIKEKSTIKIIDEKIKINKELNENDEILIEYINNINNEIKLFSKIFVENNIDKVYLEIEGEILELKKEHIFKSNEKYVKIKLIVKKDIYEIDMYKMFANCYNLISLNGISKWKKTKIINISKMFYNCTSLSSIPDIIDWDISKITDNYLMLYNCISLIFLTNLKKINKTKKLNKKNIYLRGIALTEYLNINSEITIKNMIIIDNYINFLGNKFRIRNEEIVIINGNEKELIACYKKEENSRENKFILFYKNKIINEGKEIEIKIRIIKLFVNMSYIIESSILDLSKWNTNNVIYMNYMFYKCSSLTSFPYISKWNTKNVINMSSMFCDCSSLSLLPDILKWNTNNVTNMSDMFCNCSSLSSLPDISKWNTNNIIDISYKFNNCKSLKSLPDI